MDEMRGAYRVRQYLRLAVPVSGGAGARRFVVLGMYVSSGRGPTLIHIPFAA